MRNSTVILFAGLALFGALMLIKPPDAWQPRGIRNNNPLNIRGTGDQWDGMIGVDESGFVIFATPEHGIRAATRILASYARRGITTVGEIITTWAPPIGDGGYTQDTSAYINHVSQVIGKNSSEPVRPEQYPDLLAVMIKHENGQQPYSAAQIAQGVSMAGVTA